MWFGVHLLWHYFFTSNYLKVLKTNHACLSFQCGFLATVLHVGWAHIFPRNLSSASPLHCCIDYSELLWHLILHGISFVFAYMQDEEEEESEFEGEEEEEKITRNWSVLKSTPELRKSKVSTCVWSIAHGSHLCAFDHVPPNFLFAA